MNPSQSRAYILIASFLLLCLHGIDQAHAGEVQHTLSIDSAYTHFNVHEAPRPSGKPQREQGWLPGAGFTYTRQGADRLYLRLRGSVKGGDVRYSGTTLYQSKTFTNSTSGAFIWDIEGDMGYTVVSSTLPTLALTPYGGLGYRTWNRDAPDPGEETFQWVYGALGIRADWFPSKRVRIGLDLSGHLPLSIVMNTVTYRHPALPNDAKMENGTRPGFLFAVPIAYRLNRDWSLVSAMSWERVYTGQSSGPISQPATRTELLGVNIGIQYHF